MDVKKRQLRERNFVNYVHYQVRIQKAKTPEPKKTAFTEASRAGSVASRVRSQNQLVLRPSRIIYPTRRYSPDASPRVTRQSSNKSHCDQEKVVKAPVTQAGSNANVRCKSTPVSSRLPARSAAARTSTIRASRSKNIASAPKAASETLASSRRQRSSLTIVSRSRLTRSSEAISLKTSDMKTPTQNKTKNSQMPTPEQDELDDLDMGSGSIKKAEESSEEEDSETDITSDEDDDQSPFRRDSDTEIGQYPKLESNDYSFGNYQSSYTTPFELSRVPGEFHEMHAIWLKLRSILPSQMLLDYKACLRDLLTGRVSSLNSVFRLVPGFPSHLVPSHNNLYGLLCQASGAYPFKNHEGSTLVSKHYLADTSQIGAQLILECLDSGVLPFDPTVETTILTQIRTYVRIGIKDMLQELVEQLPRGRNTIKVSDLKESLVSRLLE